MATGWDEQRSRSGQPAPPRPPSYQTPNAEKYVLEADAMRRRQLRSALLHGSARTWREHRRIWPAVVVGVVVVAVVVAAIAVVGAFRNEQDRREAEQDRLESVPALRLDVAATVPARSR